jgi:hypothetical protein
MRPLEWLSVAAKTTLAVVMIGLPCSQISVQGQDSSLRLQVKGHLCQIRGLQASGSYLVSRTDCGTQVWSLDKGRLLYVLDEYDFIEAGASTPQFYGVPSKQRTLPLRVEAVDYATGKVSLRYESNFQLADEGHGVASSTKVIGITALSVSKSFVAAVADNGAVAIWNRDTGSLVRLLSTGTPAQGMKASDRYISLQSGDTLVTYDILSGKERQRFPIDGRWALVGIKDTEDQVVVYNKSVGKSQVYSVDQVGGAPVSEVAIRSGGPMVIDTDGTGYTLVLVDKGLYIFRVVNGQAAQYPFMRTYESEITGGALLASANAYAVATTNAIVVENGKLNLNLFAFTDGAWVTFLSTGTTTKYACSPGADDKVQVLQGGQIYGINKFRETLYSPQEVADGALALVKVGGAQPPWKLPPPPGQLTFYATSAARRLKDLKVILDDKEILSFDGPKGAGSIFSTGEGASWSAEKVGVPLPLGEHKVQIIAHFKKPGMAILLGDSRENLNAIPESKMVETKLAVQPGQHFEIRAVISAGYDLSANVEGGQK